MPKAIATPTTVGAIAPASTRRQVLGGAALAALTGGAFGAAIVLPKPGEAFPAASANADAELIGLCAECDALQRQIDAMYERSAERMSHAAERAWENVRDAAVEPLADRQDPLLARICELRATTPQGNAARARTLLLWDKDPEWKDQECCWDDRLMGAIVRDLVGEG